MHEVLTLARLRMMPPDAAAALLWLRQAAGVVDTKLVAEWLAIDTANVAAWEAANASWAGFDAAGDDEIVLALRDDARRVARRSSLLSRAAAIAAVALLAVVGIGVQRSCASASDIGAWNSFAVWLTLPRIAG